MKTQFRAKCILTSNYVEVIKHHPFGDKRIVEGKIYNVKKYADKILIDGFWQNELGHYSTDKVLCFPEFAKKHLIISLKK